ncbi:MAG TPA: PstS family phosphate ABC transporter substrate-binding protein [Cryptosporangiaceae bacterium]|nr:PstS family phosphate ABC transporter substrate-binding protein [Cryptosporangiaceae bacterium]
MNRALPRHILAGTAVLALALTAACGGGNEATNTDGGELSGSVKVDGSSTVAPLSTAASELFGEEQPEVRVSVGTSGTGGGFEKFCNGETDISNASRPIKDEEIAACKANGVEYAELVVANDALTVVVSKQNTFVDCLTVTQLKKLWEPKSTVKTWNQLDPTFPAEPVKLFGPGTDSGTFDYFTDEINGAEGASRTDYTASENDNVLVQGVEGDKNALGYFGFTYYEENAAKLKAVKIDSGDGTCVEPSKATASDGTYKPLSRPLYVYVARKSMSRPEVAAFVEYYAKNIDTVVEEAKYVPLTAEQKTTLTSEVDKLGKA